MKRRLFCTGRSFALALLALGLWVSGPRSAPAQTDDLSDRTADLVEQLYRGELQRAPTDAELAAMTEEELYDTAEFYRLGHQYPNSCRAFAALAERFPGSVFAPKARLEVALTESLQDTSFDSGVAMLESVAEDYPGAPQAEEALRYVAAITSPAGPRDLEYGYDLVQRGREMGCPPLSGLLAVDMAAAVVDGGALDALAVDLPDRSEQAEFLTQMAWIVFYSGRLDESLAQFERVWTEYGDAGPAPAQALALAGDIEMVWLDRYRQGSEKLRRAVTYYPLSPSAPWALHRLAQRQRYRGNYSRALQNLTRLVDGYPGYVHIDQARSELEDTRSEVLKIQAARGISGGQETSSAAPAAPTQAVASAFPDVERTALQGDPILHCGPAVLAAAAKAFGIELDSQEANLLCPVNEGGATNFLQLASALDLLGLRARPVEMGMETLEDADKPVIVHLGRHFALLTGLDEHAARLVDDCGERSMARWRFDHEWDGYAVEVDRAREVAQAQSPKAIGKGGVDR